LQPVALHGSGFVDASGTSWNDRLAMGRVLAIGRAAAMKIANTNRAVGPRRNLAMGNWRREHGLADVD
jgi:hypothetical protein